MKKHLFHPEDFVFDELTALEDHQTALPAIAKNPRLIGLIDEAVKRVPTSHDLYLGDAREMKLRPESIHLVVTSPPYWTLKKYRNLGTRQSCKVIQVTNHLCAHPCSAEWRWQNHG